ncbi:MAG: SLC13/DASS family transporter [Alistipes sp.]|nr:SLC13/DASS family transporter [Alistipes sp.]
MENVDIAIVLLAIVTMLYLLVKGYLRPGLILFSVVVLLLCCGILTPADALAGFANKGMVTVALLFLVSEGIRRSDCLGPVMKRLFPAGSRSTIRRGYATILPTVASISAFLNNTPIVVIFIPHIKAWCSRASLPLKKFLIPLSYAAILGGMCTLIGTSTNLVVHSLMLDAGLAGFTLFELGKVGGIVALAGLGYIILFGARRLPEQVVEPRRIDSHIVEVVLAARFPGIRCTMEQFDFHKHYGAKIIAVRRDGEQLDDLEGYSYKENDTLTLAAERGFVDTWADSRVFLIITNGREHEPQAPRWKRQLSLLLLVVMVVGATVGDMFLWAAVVAVIMAFCNIFPAKKYTKFISWDILVTIASAFAISRAMTLSGLADAIALSLIELSGSLSPRALLIAIYLTTNIITELITNNAAAAFAFPVALSVASQAGINPTPLCVAICIAASASFCTPIGYQTNMIVQGLGGYSFSDFVRIGLPLSIITFAVSIIFIPIFWSF